VPAKQPPLFPTLAASATDFGERLRLARLRRRFPAATVAARAGIARATLSRAEHGDPSVALGTYLRILRVLSLESDISLLARDDELGRKLQDLGLPTRRRAPTSGPKHAPGRRSDGDRRDKRGSATGL
jgi:transcriptional regulator with XRE-family HTH domain